MKTQFSILFIVMISVILPACNKDTNPLDGNNAAAELSAGNELPFTLPTFSNVANEEQTKGIYFYDPQIADIIFRSAGTANAISTRLKLWVEIRNPDLRIFADTEIDSFFSDTTYWNGIQTQEIHNRAGGISFAGMDTALLALPFSLPQLDNHRPNVVANTNMIVHTKIKENFVGNNIPYDIERGALRRTDHNYIGFRNVKDGYLFFIELEGRYTIKSIQIRKDN